MRKSVGIAVSISILLIGFIGSSTATRTGFKPFIPLPEKPAEFTFFVDNSAFLAFGFLEFAFKEKNWVRQQVDVSNDGSSSIASGKKEVVIPNGPLEMMTCGHVKCGPDEETKLICGKSFIPAQLAVDKIHRINFSTNRACRNRSTDSFAQTR